MHATFSLAMLCSLSSKSPRTCSLLQVTPRSLGVAYLERDDDLDFSLMDALLSAHPQQQHVPTSCSSRPSPTVVDDTKSRRVTFVDKIWECMTGHGTFQI